MNYLAHLFLSLDDPELMLGNFIADDIPLSEVNLLPERIRLGVYLHRQIDEYTDDHAGFKNGVLLYRPHHRKYASVVIDIINDHLLAQNWKTYTDVSLTLFADRVYSNFDKGVDKLPIHAQKHVQSLLKYKYLEGYYRKEGITEVMRRMDNRTRFPSDFVSSVDQLYESWDEFEKHFHDLFGALKSNLPDMLERAIIESKNN